jgi:hypothetical protein
MRAGAVSGGRKCGKLPLDTAKNGGYTRQTIAVYRAYLLLALLAPSRGNPPSQGAARQANLGAYNAQTPKAVGFHPQEAQAEAGRSKQKQLVFFSQCQRIGQPWQTIKAEYLKNGSLQHDSPSLQQLQIVANCCRLLQGGIGGGAKAEARPKKAKSKLR